MRSFYSVLVFFMVLAFPAVQADQKYNPYSSKWETTTPEAKLKYNAYEGDWHYVEPDLKVEYNPYEGKWEYPNTGGEHDINSSPFEFYDE